MDSATNVRIDAPGFESGLARKRTALDQLLRSDLALLEALLVAIDACQLMCVSRVCWRWMHAAEISLRASCEGFAWQPPRRARLQALASSALKWRGLFLARSCRACFQRPGDFAVRLSGNASPCLLLCGACCKAPAVVHMLQARHLTLDVTGLSGRALYSQKADRFCSDVSRFATR